MGLIKLLIESKNRFNKISGKESVLLGVGGYAW
jgi:hypothetical protein